MGFRPDSERQRAWHRWVDQHRDTLVRCSLPEFVFSDEMTWLRFLEHGGWHHQPGWSVSMLSSHQAAAFHDFIENEYGGEEYRYLLQNLNDVRRKSSSA
jgi:hypothetical protein